MIAMIHYTFGAIVTLPPTPARRSRAPVFCFSGVTPVPEKSTSKKTRGAAARKSSTTKPKPATKRAAKPARDGQKRSASPAAPAPRRPAVVAPKAPAGKPVRADSGLSARDLEQFREMLLAKRAQLVGDMKTMKAEALSRQEAAGDLSSMPIHMADLGTDNYEQEFTLGLIESERGLLREIDAAIKRIDEGTYGLCLATGKPIGKARLKAQPWAKYSYEYMLAQERGQTRRF
jgi:RNA polymerase-binding protein DksA